jgi:DNA polymerase elongation subunit (family B)
MYQNIYCSRNDKFTQVHLWDDQAGHVEFSVKHYGYKKSPTGVYRSLYGDKLKKVVMWTREDLEKKRIFESDVFPETRVLVDRYYKSDELSTGHITLYLDIEVDSSDGFPDPKVAAREVTSISFYDDKSKQYQAHALSDTLKSKKEDDVTIIAYDTEKELLETFMDEYKRISPTIITGWNVDTFDMTYLVNRIRIVLGYEVANGFSPIRKVYSNERRNKDVVIAGVSILDYLALYRKFTFKQQSSYRLDDIANLEVGAKKVEFEGTLADLYERDIETFVRYNIQDVKLVVDLDKKLDLITLARGICHLGHVPYEDVFYSSRYIEGAMLVYMKKLGIIAPNKNINFKGASYGDMRKQVEKYTGAYVKEPVPGTYDWVYDLDVTSMYPSVIMTLNISPEMKIGKLEGWNSDDFVKGVDKTYTLVNNDVVAHKFTTESLKEYFDKEHVSVASNGCIYKTEKQGFIPAILDKWFNERVEFRKLAKKYSDQGDKVKADYFNRRQYIQKIMLNTVYGVFGLPVFRFYDSQNSEATTLTGQRMIRFSQQMVNQVYNNELNDDLDHVLYTDTDSCFVSAVPLIKHRFPEIDTTNDTQMVDKVLAITSEIQEFLNKSYDPFAQRLLNVKGEHRFSIKQEMIAKRIFLVAKKRYGQWIINDNGASVDKIDVKGLDIIKSSFPPAFKRFMQSILKDILSAVSKEKIDEKVIKFKRNVNNQDIYDIAIPTGVKGIHKYTVKSKERQFGSVMKKGTPAHVKAAIHYNMLLNKFRLERKFVPIGNNEKIKWVYLKPNPYAMNNIAFKGNDDPGEIIEFINTYIDRDAIIQGALQKKLNVFYRAKSWDDPVDKTSSLERFF